MARIARVVAPTGRRSIATGGAARPQCGPTRNPWKAYEYVGRDEIPASLSRRRNNMPGFHPGLRCSACSAVSAVKAAGRCHCHSAPACRQAGSALVTPLPALAYKNNACGAIVSPSSALVYKNRCPRVSRSLFPVPRSPLLGVIHNGVWPCVHVKTVKFGSKSIKKTTFSVKKGSKRRAFRHAHLNILGGHPLWR